MSAAMIALHPPCAPRRRHLDRRPVRTATRLHQAWWGSALRGIHRTPGHSIDREPVSSAGRHQRFADQSHVCEPGM